jgi:2-polyprenyl-6-methoxyphenol hydroxylase-like FAD-dependent oxidoreductase
VSDHNSRSTLKSEVSVLIVGAGPVGLTLALELERFGVPYRIIEKNAGPSNATKAMAIHSRTLEIFRQLGVADRMISAGKQIRRFRANSNGKTILLYNFELLDAAYPFLLSLPQPRTEAILLDELQSGGDRVEWRTSLTGFVQNDDQVIAEIVHDGGGRETVTCRWLVGCDGSRSIVRETLGVAFDGDSYHRHFMLADVDIEWDGDRDEGAFFLGSQQGYVACAPLDHDGRYRLFVEMPYDLPPREEQPRLDVETFQALCEGRGQHMRLANASSTTIAAFHHRRTDRQHVGRVFLAGDAAHIGSPIGGQYMNLGISEAHNLAWKLACVHSGAANRSLLDSYDPERLPVAATAEKTAHVLTKILTLQQPLLVRARDFVFPRITGLDRMSRRLPWMISGHRYHYRTSPIVEDARGTLTFRERRVRASSGHGGPVPRAGELAPDVALWYAESQLPQRLIDLYDGRFTLLLFAAGDPAAHDARNLVGLGARLEREYPWIHPYLVIDALERPELGAAISVVLDPDRRLHRRYAAGSGPIVLVRPDGYIGFIGTRSTELREYLEKRSELRGELSDVQAGFTPVRTSAKAQRAL